MTTVQDHLKRFPNARPSTLVYIQRRHDTTERLQAEIAAAQRVNEYRDEIGYVSWPRRVLSALIRGWGAV